MTSLISVAATPLSAALRPPARENGEIEYGGLPVNYAIFVIALCATRFRCAIVRR